MHRITTIVCLLALALLTGAFSGCRNANAPGNYSYKDGIDYSTLKTYRLVPFSHGTLAVYPVLSTQATTIYQTFDKLLAARGFTPAAEGALADFEVIINFYEEQTINPNIQMQPAIVAESYMPPIRHQGYLSMDIVRSGMSVFRSWSPWGVPMDRFGANTAAEMVQWCLEKFPPKTKAEVPEVILLQE